jgi:transcriptional regulator with XRE-family HTH domain
MMTVSHLEGRAQMNRKLSEAILEKYRNYAHFGDAIGMNRQQVNRYVNGMNTPRHTTVERFAKGLGISVKECTKLFDVTA